MPPDELTITISLVCRLSRGSQNNAITSKSWEASRRHRHPKELLTID